MSARKRESNYVHKSLLCIAIVHISLLFIISVQLVLIPVSHLSLVVLYPSVYSSFSAITKHLLRSQSPLGNFGYLREIYLSTIWDYCLSCTLSCNAACSIIHIADHFKTLFH